MHNLKKLPLLAMLLCIEVNFGIVLEAKGVKIEDLEDCLMPKRQSRLILLMVDIFELYNTRFSQFAEFSREKLKINIVIPAI